MRTYAAPPAKAGGVPVPDCDIVPDAEPLWLPEGEGELDEDDEVEDVGDPDDEDEAEPEPDDDGDAESVDECERDFDRDAVEESEPANDACSRRSTLGAT